MKFLIMYFFCSIIIIDNINALHTKTNTQNQDIARALVQKIGSYAQIAGTVVKVYPVRGASPTVDVQDLTVNQDITVEGKLFLTVQIRAFKGKTVLFILTIKRFNAFSFKEFIALFPTICFS